MGRTVGELDMTMEYSEFLHWQAFNLMEPIGISREDLLFGNVAKTIADANVPDHNCTFESFMLFKQHVERTVEDVCDDINARMAGFM